MRDDNVTPAQLLVPLVRALVRRGYVRRRADVHRIFGDIVPRDTIDAAIDEANEILRSDGHTPLTRV